VGHVRLMEPEAGGGTTTTAPQLSFVFHKLGSRSTAMDPMRLVPHLRAEV